MEPERPCQILISGTHPAISPTAFRRTQLSFAKGTPSVIFIQRAKQDKTGSWS